MAKRRCPSKEKLDQERETIVRGTVMTLYWALTPGMSAEEVMRKITSNGGHHHLMEIAHPETDDMEGDEYGAALDEFEGTLAGWVEEIAEGHAAHVKRMEKRDR